MYISSNVSDTACDLPSSSAETLPTASWIKSRTKKDQEIELPECEYKDWTSKLTANLCRLNQASTTTAAANLKLGGSNQPARLISKRHSLQAEVLMALRQDSDALLQRRESLLQLRKFSEGHTPPTPPRRGTFKTERTDAGYAIDLLDTLMLRRENKYVRFESEAMEKKKHAFFANECLQQRAENTQPRLERRQSHPNRPVHIYKESHARNQITELNSLVGTGDISFESKLCMLPNVLLCVLKNSSDRNAKPRNEPNSVTESAKNLLARVRQNRVENRLELDLSSHQQNNERSTMTIVETKKSPAQPPADRSRRYISLNHYTPSTGKTKRSSSLATVTTTKYSLPLPSLRSTAGGSNGSIPTQPTANRRWSSALPLSSTKLYKPHPLHHQQDTSDRPRQTSHYLAKKSTLDKSTGKKRGSVAIGKRNDSSRTLDRYVALLGKSRFQKE